MNPELQNEIAKLIESARAAGQDAYAFISAQAPDAIEQMLRYEMFKACLFLTLSSAFAYFLIWLGRCVEDAKRQSLAQSNAAPYRRHENSDYPPKALFYWLALLVFLAGFSICGSRIVKIKLAPKLVVMEWVKEVVR